MSRRPEILTHTKRRAWKNCHRYFWWSHEQQLTLRTARRGQRRGTIWGQALRDISTEVAGGSPVNDAVDRACDYIESAHALLMDDTLTEEQTAELDLDALKMQPILRAYIEIYGVDSRREVEYDLPLPNPATKRTSRAFRLGGKIDGVVPLGNQHARIIEDKLVGQIQKVMIDRLPLDDQTSEYVLAFRAMGWTTEIDYRHTRFPGINPTKAKKLKTKEHPAESSDEFLDRLTQDIEDRQDFYFDRQLLVFPDEHLSDFSQGRWEVAQDILRARRSRNPMAAFYMNPNHCFEFGGCPFIPLCTRQPDAESLYVVDGDNAELGLVMEKYAQKS